MGDSTSRFVGSSCYLGGFVSASKSMWLVQVMMPLTDA